MSRAELQPQQARLSCENFVLDNLELFRLTTDGLYYELERQLQRHGYHTGMMGSYIHAAGDVPVLLVAHMDTVFENTAGYGGYSGLSGLYDYPTPTTARLRINPSTPRPIFHDAGIDALWSPWGLGADDRAGVLSILMLLDAGYRPHVLFTDEEESGGGGAYDFVDTLKGYAALDVDYVVELDRQGHMEAVFYDDRSEKLRSHVLAYGFHEGIGLFTDISIICPALGISGVNLSVGYYRQHREQEVLVLPELADTVNAVARMLDDAASQPRKLFRYGYPPPKPVVTKGKTATVGSKKHGPKGKH